MGVAGGNGGPLAGTVLRHIHAGSDALGPGQFQQPGGAFAIKCRQVERAADLENIHLVQQTQVHVLKTELCAGTGILEKVAVTPVIDQDEGPGLVCVGGALDVIHAHAGFLCDLQAVVCQCIPAGQSYEVDLVSQLCQINGVVIGIAAAFYSNFLYAVGVIVKDDLGHGVHQQICHHLAYAKNSHSCSPLCDHFDDCLMIPD